MRETRVEVDRGRVRDMISFLRIELELDAKVALLTFGGWFLKKLL